MTDCHSTLETCHSNNKLNQVKNISHKSRLRTNFFGATSFGKRDILSNDKKIFNEGKIAKLQGEELIAWLHYI